MATDYIVLQQVGGGAWKSLGQVVEATNDLQAIKAATTGSNDKTGTFVAVPARSWRPRTRTVETKEIDRWA